MRKIEAEMMMLVVGKSGRIGEAESVWLAPETCISEPEAGDADGIAGRNTEGGRGGVRAL